MTKEELEVLKEYIKENKLDTPNRKRWRVDQRNYLSKYMESKGMPHWEIAEVLNRDRTTVIHGLKTYEALKGFKYFHQNVYQLMVDFPIVGYAEKYRLKMSNRSTVLATFNTEQFSKVVEVKRENQLKTYEEALKFIVESYEA
jgi:hypothetical protein